ncbi:MAG TPA: galactokinase family protein, partial [Microbacterium sp.]|nr:galactokinase family protein [Microbacterium sp.]
MTAQNAATTLLREVTGREADGVWSAPGRVNLIGEHTDYNEGFVLPFAIEHRTAAAVARRDDDVIRVTSTFAEDPVEVSLAELDDAIARGGLDWAAYPLGVAWALRRAAPDAETFGVDIAIASDVPVGAGLSSSAAIEGAVASALNDEWNAGLSPVELATVGRTAENDAVGAPTGIMDQMASMLGVADAATFLDCRTLETDSVELGFGPAGLTLLVMDTNVEHSHATGGYRERR